MKKITFILLVIIQNPLACSSRNIRRPEQAPSASALKTQEAPEKIITGASQLDILLPLLINKRVALVVNQTSMIEKTHLADTLKRSGVDLKKIFVPEHGFRGAADAGEHLKDDLDAKTGLPLISLYGNNKKPTAEQLAGIDLIIFDIQDVGVRFYTYISTLHYIMEACAENEKKLIVLDRPNPNGSYIDGPVLQPAFKSFVGVHPIPVVHGLTIGELAKMINGEGWLSAGKKCDLQIIPVKNWSHSTPYSLPVKPSPNLPNDQSIKLYPSLGFFEGTVISVGRGTQTPFQVIGNPELKNQPYSFTPVSIEGMAKNPPYESKTCFGLDLRTAVIKSAINLNYLISMYNAYPDKEKFFNNFFDKLAGNAELKKQIKDGLTEDQIRQRWQKDLEAFQTKRKKYLLYE